MLGGKRIRAEIDLIRRDTLIRAQLHPDVRSGESNRKTGLSLFFKRVRPRKVVREIVIHPVARCPPVETDTATEGNGVSFGKNTQRNISADVHILAAVTERMVLGIGPPTEIFAHLTFYRTVNVSAVFVMSLVFEQVVLHRELVIMVYVVADPGVDDAHHAVAVPRLQLHEHLV